MVFSRNVLVVLMITIVALFGAGELIAGDGTLHRLADGMEIHMGIAHVAKDGQDTSLQQQVKASALQSQKHYLSIALFDKQTGKPITDAVVEARVGEVGTSSHSQLLQKQHAAETVLYGGEFMFPAKGPYWIDLKVTRLGRPQATIVRFEWNHI